MPMVEMSDKTLEAFQKWTDAEKTVDVTSVDEWNELKMMAMSACIHFSFDAGMQETEPTISNKD
jgi:hypothetical protein